MFGGFLTRMPTEDTLLAIVSMRREGRSKGKATYGKDVSRFPIRYTHVQKASCLLPSPLGTGLGPKSPDRCISLDSSAYHQTDKPVIPEAQTHQQTATIKRERDTKNPQQKHRQEQPPPTPQSTHPPHSDSAETRTPQSSTESSRAAPHQ